MFLIPGIVECVSDRYQLYLDYLADRNTDVVRKYDLTNSSDTYIDVHYGLYGNRPKVVHCQFTVDIPKDWNKNKQTWLNTTAQQWFDNLNGGQLQYILNRCKSRTEYDCNNEYVKIAEDHVKKYAPWLLE